MRHEDLNYWHVIAAISAAVTVVAALGEWVFHWWESPGDVVSLVALLVIVLASGFAASKSDIRRVERILGSLRDGQQRHTEILESLVEGQRHHTRILESLAEGQRRQTQLLEEAVQFFRRTPS